MSRLTTYKTSPITYKDIKGRWGAVYTEINPYEFRVNRDFVGTRGYNNRWGRYIGNLCVMMDYLRVQRPEYFPVYDKILRERNKRKGVKLNEEELHKMKLEVLALLKPETRRKFTFNGGIVA